ncbi:MAG: preprotein translocase subunit SecY [Alphaproteobacteria bacterium]|nr:preprotein translocase subunit SecY [Alphaproteobacteria bacterium]
MSYKKESSSHHDLQLRVFFTLLVLLVCRIGSFIPIAGIDAVAMTNFAQQNQNGILGIFNVLSGGSLARMSVFALAIMPYITASIIIQLLTMAYKPLEELKKEGEVGRKKINQLTRILTVLLASTHAFGIASGLIKMSSDTAPIVVIDHSFFMFSAVTTLVVGTILLMWLGEQISARGIGNGSSLIIFLGIVSGLPSALISTLELARKGSISSLTVLSILLLIAFMIMMIVFFERAQRKVLVQYPKRQVGNKIYGGDSSYIPLKLNTAGVIPPIFANSVLLFPLTIANLAGSDSGILQEIAIHVNRGKPLYIALNAILIVFFTFFYTTAVFNSEETANNLRKYGAYVPGRRPGAHTAEYFDYLLTRITVLGAIYMCVICLIPEIIATRVTLTFALGGTSMLIVVNVILDTFTQVQTYLFSSRYENIIKKVKIK